ncbi:MAG: hypothetical protein K9N55_11125 [Phycisphaerae bacterium]|nr:hypothetical protein [Phycisphaerae bacterium]
MTETSIINPLLVAIVIFELLGCAMTEYTTNEPITKIVYSFKDASVPPQYHRSYTITLTRDQSHILVDSYGDILVDQTKEIPESIIDDLAKYIETCQIKEKHLKSDTTICTGGTSKSLTVYSDRTVLLKGTVYQRGGRLEGNLKGDIDSFVTKLEGLIPGFTDLLK